MFKKKGDNKFGNIALSIIIILVLSMIFFTAKYNGILGDKEQAYKEGYKEAIKDIMYNNKPEYKFKIRKDTIWFKN